MDLPRVVAYVEDDEEGNTWVYLDSDVPIVAATSMVGWRQTKGLALMTVRLRVGSRIVLPLGASPHASLSEQHLKTGRLLLTEASSL